MITPEYLNEIIEGTEYAVRKAESTILNKICKRIVASFNANEENIIIPSTITQMHQLMDMGMTHSEIQQIVEKSLPSIQKEVKQAFLQSAQEISNYNTDIAKEIIEKEGFDIEIPKYEEVGLPKDASFLNMTASEIRTLEQIYTKTGKTVENMCKSLPIAGSTLYLNACDDAFMKIQSGMNPNTAILDAIHQVSTDGLKIVSYDSGHVDRSEVAVARAVRSGINKANAEIVLTRCAEMGVGFVRVSEHYGARVTKQEDFTNHAHWQGKVYSLNWNSSIFKEKRVDKQNEKQLNESGFSWLNDLRYSLEEKKIPKIGKPIEKTDNKEAYLLQLEDVLSDAYEYQRTTENLNLVPNEKSFDKGKRVGEGIKNIDEKLIKSLQETMEELTKEYETSLQKIDLMDLQEKAGHYNSFAFVSHDYDTAKSTLKLSYGKMKDYDNHVSRIKELMQKGYAVKIPEEYAEKYIFTHEFAHTLLDTGSKLNNSRNWAKLDYSKVKKARKEIQSAYDDYIKEFGTLSEKKKKAEMDVILNGNAESAVEAQKLIAELNKLEISKYALTNADEFMAECFTLSRYTDSDNVYVKRIMEIINKYFAR